MQDFFAMFFEFFGTVLCTASDDLFEYVYIPAGFAWLIVTLLWVILFYQGFFVWKRKARFDTRLNWILWMLVSSILTTIIVWIITDSSLKNQDVLYGPADYSEFLCLVFFWSLILYFLFSIPIKFINPSRRKIPF